MKTQGINVIGGYVVGSTFVVGRSVPDAFWSRLKHALQKAALLAEFQADYERERAALLSSLPEYMPEQYVAKATAEERLFRRWVERVMPSERGPWPWERGWDEQRVDEYLWRTP